MRITTGPMRLGRWFPFLQWPRPDAAMARGEFVAGLTVSLVVVPQSVAYAALAGMPLVAGIYASFFPALVAVLWSASPRVSVGATALTSLLVMASLAGLAVPGSTDWIALAAWLALLSGGIQVTLGLMRFGWILNLVSTPVLAGFTQAAAVLIIGSQLKALLGLPAQWDFTQGPWSFHTEAAALGLGCLVFLFTGKKLAPHAPLLMVAVVGAGLISYASDFAVRGGPVIGHLPSGLPRLDWPTVPSWDILATLALPALVIALVSFLETASSSKIDHQTAQTPRNDNQDLIAQGLAKVAAGMTGGFPTSSSFARSAINLYAGARSGWATVVTVVMVAVVLLWLTPALYHIPSAALAAVVIAAVSNLLKPRQFIQMRRLFPTEALTMAATFIATLLTAPQIYWGVLTGVMLGLIGFLYQRLHPRIIELGLHPDGSLRDRHLWQLPALAPHTYALRMDAALDFATASDFERTIADYLSAHAGTRHIYLFAHAINRIDATGVESFAAFSTTLRTSGITLHICGMKLPVENLLKRAGLLNADAALKLYRTEAEALQGIAERANTPALANNPLKPV